MSVDLVAVLGKSCTKCNTFYNTPSGEFCHRRKNGNWGNPWDCKSSITCFNEIKVSK